MVAAGDFGGRRAPYAPISALERFFERMRDRAVPDHVDHRFLQRLNVASNNEYSLLSALKFLGILDDRGRPTHAYRLLQSTDRFQETLRHLVETAYRPVFEVGADRWPADELVNFFRTESSPSQAKNAARFFQAVCRLAGTEPEAAPSPARPSPPVAPLSVPQGSGEDAAGLDLSLLAAKARLLEKMPAPAPQWSAEEYRKICEIFLELVKNLDATG